MLNNIKIGMGLVSVFLLTGCTQSNIQNIVKDSKVVFSNDLIVTKKTCIQQSHYPDKTLKDIEKDLIKKTKDLVFSELYGKEITQNAANNENLKEAALNSIKLKNEPIFDNGNNFGEICSNISTYVTSEDMNRFSFKEIYLENYCFKQPKVMMQDIRRNAKQAASRQLFMENISSNQFSDNNIDDYLHEFKIYNEKLGSDNMGYCFDAKAKILPFEIESKKMRPNNKLKIQSAFGGIPPKFEKDQVWSGIYNCELTKTPLELSIKSVNKNYITAVLEFKNLLKAQDKYDLVGMYFKDTNNLKFNERSTWFNSVDSGLINSKSEKNIKVDGFINNEVYQGTIKINSCQGDFTIKPEQR